MEPNSSPTDIERAVAAKCPIEMGGYDSLEQLQQVWDTRCPNDSAPMTNKDEYNACIAALKTWNTRYTGPAGF